MNIAILKKELELIDKITNESYQIINNRTYLSIGVKMPATSSLSSVISERFSPIIAEYIETDLIKSNLYIENCVEHLNQWIENDDFIYTPYQIIQLKERVLIGEKTHLTYVDNLSNIEDKLVYLDKRLKDAVLENNAHRFYSNDIKLVGRSNSSLQITVYYDLEYYYEILSKLINNIEKDITDEDLIEKYEELAMTFEEMESLVWLISWVKTNRPSKKDFELWLDYKIETNDIVTNYDLNGFDSDYLNQKREKGEISIIKTIIEDLKWDDKVIIKNNNDQKYNLKFEKEENFVFLFTDKDGLYFFYNPTENTIRNIFDVNTGLYLYKGFVTWQHEVIRLDTIKIENPFDMYEKNVQIKKDILKRIKDEEIILWYDNELILKTLVEKLFEEKKDLQIDINL